MMDVLDVGEKVVDVVKSLKERYDAMQENPGAADALFKSFELMASHLQSLNDKGHDTLRRLPSPHGKIHEDKLSELNTLVKETIDKLRDKIEKLENVFYATTHAKGDKAEFEELKKDADRCSALILQISQFLAPWAEKGDCTQDGDRVSHDGDTFRPCFNAPRNPRGITIDFASKTSDGKPATWEGELKALLLEDKASNAVGAVAHGMGGVGKTCTLRALAADEEVQALFPGGTYFMSLGADADTGRVIRELCDSIEAAGGAKLSSGLRGEPDLKLVIRKASNWFAGHACLFVFDDLWRSNDIGKDILEKLSVLTSHGGKGKGASVLLYSTRDNQLSIQGSTVTFDARKPVGEAATTILLNTAGAVPAEAEDAVCQNAVTGILKMCGGLPVTLNLCGTAVNQMRAKWDGDKRDAWNLFWKRLESKDLITGTPDCYTPLEKALLVSLEFLDNHSAKTEAHDTGLCLSYQQMHRALCVLKKQDWVPSSVLCKTWRLRSVKCAEKVVELMDGVGVADKEYRKVEGGAWLLGLRLHDLVHDFAVQEAKRHKEELQWHTAVLDEYSSRYSCTSAGTRSETLWPVYMDSVEDGGYMFRNVCRLLQRAGRFQELGCLVHSARWVDKVFDMNGILQYEQDVKTYIESVPARGGALSGKSAKLEDGEEGDLKESLNRIGRIVRLCLPYCLVNRREVWFQLYARLKGTGRRSTWMEDMLSEIERHAPRPWLRVAGPCLKGADDAMVGNYRWGREVLDVRLVNGTELMSVGISADSPSAVCIGRHMSNGESNTVELVCDAVASSTVEVREEEGMGVSVGDERRHSHSPPSEGERRRPVRRGRVLRCVDKMKALLRLRCVKSEEEEVHRSASTRVSVNEEDRVCCGALFADGKRVVTGWSSGAVRVWDTRTGQPIWEQENGHDDEVQAVAVSEDGTRVVSGSFDCTVRLWDVPSGQAVGEPFTGHTSVVRSVAVSQDGTRIVSGSDDGTVRVWDVPSGQAVGEPFTGHTRWVASVAVSQDGTRVVSGSVDCTVRVWDVPSGQAVGEPFTGHTDLVRSVAVSQDGTRVVSGSFDCTVRVWDVPSGQAVGEPLTGHRECVRRVAVSQDGTRVVSGSDDDTVRLWDVASGSHVRIAEDEDWIGRWDALCEEYLNGDTPQTRGKAQIRTSVVATGREVLYRRGSEETVLATFGQIRDFSVNVRHGVVAVAVEHAVVIARVVE